MVKEEPQNPIRCMFCPRIVGSQALHNHIVVAHPDDFKQMKDADYEKYRKANVVRKADVNNPLRAEWRQQNNIPEK